MKILTKAMISEIIKERYGDIKFEDGIQRLKKENLVTVMNRKSTNKKYSVCETLLLDT